MLLLNPFRFVASGGGAGAHRYWSVKCLGTPPVGEYDLYEIEMRTSIGGANVCTGGTAIADDFYSGFPPSRAFDGNIATQWLTVNANKYVGYDFGAGNDQEIVQYRLSVNVGHTVEAPGACEFRWSDDGLTWMVVDSFSGANWSTYSITRTL